VTVPGPAAENSPSLVLPAGTGGKEKPLFGQGWK
jgi:hypothetical protein